MSLTIRLLPYDSTIRYLLLDTVSYLLSQISEDFDITIRDLNEVIIRSEEGAKAIIETLEGFFGRLGSYLEKFMQNRKDIPIHKNDRKHLEGVLGRNIGTGEGFLQVTAEILKRSSLNPSDLEELSKIDLQGKKNVKVVLGDKKLAKYPLPQCMAFDRYESRHEFPRGRFGSKIEIRLSKPWYLMLLAGLATSYMGARAVQRGVSEFYLIHVPSNSLEFYVMDRVLFSHFFSDEGLLERLKEIRIYPTRHIPYIMYTACELLTSFKQKESLFQIFLSKPLPEIIFDRVRTDGKAFVLIERVAVSYSDILMRLSKFSEEVLREIARCARMALRDIDFEHYLRFVTNLYLALSGSAKMHDVAYYYGRILIEHELESKKPEERGPILRRRSRIIKELLALR